MISKNCLLVMIINQNSGKVKHYFQFSYYSRKFFRIALQKKLTVSSLQPAATQNMDKCVHIEKIPASTCMLWILTSQNLLTSSCTVHRRKFPCSPRYMLTFAWFLQDCKLFLFLLPNYAPLLMLLLSAWSSPNNTHIITLLLTLVNTFFFLCVYFTTFKHF